VRVGLFEVQSCIIGKIKRTWGILPVVVLVNKGGEVKEKS